MQKSFFSCRTVASKYLIQGTCFFSLMISVSLSGMVGNEAKYLLGILNKARSVAPALSPVQSYYFARGKESFLEDVSKGLIKPRAVHDVARLFTCKPFLQPDDVTRIFFNRLDSMDEVRNASKNHPDYQPAIAQLEQELVADSLEFVQTAIEIDPQSVGKVIDRVPSLLNQPIFYLHGYGTREGTLLNYVEDEAAEEPDPSRLTSLNFVKKDLLARGAKKLGELDIEK